MVLGGRPPGRVGHCQGTRFQYLPPVMAGVLFLREARQIEICQHRWMDLYSYINSYSQNKTSLEIPKLIFSSSPFGEILSVLEEDWDPFHDDSRILLDKKALVECLFVLRSGIVRSRTSDLRVMSCNPITARFCEKLLFLHSFRVYGSNAPEELWLTNASITKQWIVVESF